MSKTAIPKVFGEHFVSDFFVKNFLATFKHEFFFDHHLRFDFKISAYIMLSKDQNHLFAVLI